MNDVFLAGHTHIAAYGAGSGSATIGSAGHGTHARHHILTFKAHYYDGRSHHRAYQRREKRAIDKVCIVLAQYRLVQLHHLYAGYYKSFT